MKLSYTQKKDFFGVCSVDDKKFVSSELQADADDETRESFS